MKVYHFTATIAILLSGVLEMWSVVLIARNRIFVPQQSRKSKDSKNV